jgi:hypothetical protein
MNNVATRGEGKEVPPEGLKHLRPAPALPGITRIMTDFLQEMPDLRAKHLGFDKRQVGRAEPLEQITQRVDHSG